MSESYPQDRQKLVQLNNEIAQHASRKDLEKAMKLYHVAIETSIANSHTYAAAMNANIRCGSMQGAEEVMEQMASRGRKRDVIICTTMMKGYCAEGRLMKAFELFNSMLTKSPIVEPNIRTVNTLLRGCITTGNLELAEALQKVCVSKKIEPDVSFWEYLITLMCQGLKIKQVLPIVGRLKGDATMSNGMINMHLNIARAAAILGDWTACNKALGVANSFLQSNGEIPVSDSTGEEQEGKKLVVGGKRSWKASQNTEGMHVMTRKSLVCRALLTPLLTPLLTLLLTFILTPLLTPLLTSIIYTPIRFPREILRNI